MECSCYCGVLSALWQRTQQRSCVGPHNHDARMRHKSFLHAAAPGFVRVTSDSLAMLLWRQLGWTCVPMHFSQQLTHTMSCWALGRGQCNSVHSIVTLTLMKWLLVSWTGLSWMHNADIYCVYMSAWHEVVNGAKCYNCCLSAETHASAWTLRHPFAGCIRTACSNDRAWVVTLQEVASVVRYLLLQSGRPLVSMW